MHPSKNHLHLAQHREQRENAPTVHEHLPSTRPTQQPRNRRHCPVQIRWEKAAIGDGVGGGAESRRKLGLRRSRRGLLENHFGVAEVTWLYERLWGIRLSIMPPSAWLICGNQDACQ